MKAKAGTISFSYKIFMKSFNVYTINYVQISENLRNTHFEFKTLNSPTVNGRRGEG